MSSQIWWYVARASGVVGSLVLTASVICGVLTPAKLADGQRPAWFLDLHRWLAGLTIGFVAIHMGALVADSYIEFGFTELVVPFASEWEPLPVALGVLATWIIVIVHVTSLLMKRLPRHVWRKIHLTSYLAFFLTSLHGTLAGTDAPNLLYQAASLAAIAAVIFVTIFRVMTRRQPRNRPKTPRNRKSVEAGSARSR
ncbi:MAG: ferric reductase-like transmembrane domain-containing protein [Acidimicrobiales bacterium]